MDPAHAGLFQIEASTESMDPEHADLDVSCLMNISVDMFTSHLPGSGYSEQEDYSMTPHSEFSRRQFFSRSSSTDSLRVESQNQALTDHSSPSNANERRNKQCSKCTEINRLRDKEIRLVCSARYCDKCDLEAMGSMLEGGICVRCTKKPICELQPQHFGKPTRPLKCRLGTPGAQKIVEADKECSGNHLRPKKISVNGQILVEPGRYWSHGHWMKAKVRHLRNWVSLSTPKCHGIVAPEQSRPVPAYLDSTSHKILLLGHSGCGTSTIMKQAKFLWGKSFTLKEQQDIKALIQRSIFKYIVMLLEARQRFKEERNVKIGEKKQRMPSTSNSDGVTNSENDYKFIAATVKEKANWFLQMDRCGKLEKYYTDTKFSPYIDSMWKDHAIQATYKRKAEIHMLPDAAEYFLKKVMEIFKEDYVPSDDDILCIEGRAQDCLITEIQFSMDEEAAASRAFYEGHDELLAETRYHLIRVSSGDTEDCCELLRMFDDARALVFCVALDSYCQMRPDGKNVMLATRDMFERVSTHPTFKHKRTVLFFNKFDSFKTKLPDIPLTVCEWFAAYNPARISKCAAEDQAYTYVARMFKDHFKRINPNGGKLYMFRLQASKQSSVEDGFQHLKEIIRWEESRRRVRPSTSAYFTAKSGFSCHMATT